MLDAYTNEYRFDYPSLDNIIPYTKVYRGLGEQIALLVNFGYFSREIITRPDLSELMKIYTAEAYSAGGYLYVPYGMVCDDGKGGWDAFSADMDKLYPYYDFIHNNGIYYEGLKSQARIGVFYSYAGIKNRGNDMDSSFYGISNMLVDAHHQYEVIYVGDGDWMEDSIKPEDFSRFNVVVLPNIECISDRDLSMVLDYVKGGGNVICFGNFAIKDQNKNPIKRNELSELLKQGNHRYGLGQFVYVSDNLGDNYNSTQDRQSKDRMENMLSSFVKDDVTIDAGRDIEIVPYWSSKNKAEVIHLINRNYDPGAQKINSPGNINLSFNLNPELLGKELKVTFDSPDGNGPIELEYRTDGSTLSVTVPNLVTYGVVYISGKDQG